jgi:hypothetical protein
VKIAFDENIPAAMTRIFVALSQTSEVLTAEIVSVSDYRPITERGDENWLRRFAADGGQIIISGDTRMRARPHELLALSQSGLISYFFERKWSGRNFFTKAAMLMHWWPEVRKQMDTAEKGSCWEIPFPWTYRSLETVTVKPDALIKVRRAKRDRDS